MVMKCNIFNNLYVILMDILQNTVQWHIYKLASLCVYFCAWILHSCDYFIMRNVRKIREGSVIEHWRRFGKVEQSYSSYEMLTLKYSEVDVSLYNNRRRDWNCKFLRTEQIIIYAPPHLTEVTLYSLRIFSFFPHLL